MEEDFSDFIVIFLSLCTYLCKMNQNFMFSLDEKQ